MRLIEKGNTVTLRRPDEKSKDNRGKKRQCGEDEKRLRRKIWQYRKTNARLSRTEKKEDGGREGVLCWKELFVIWKEGFVT
jgi:hypothetical protein